MAGPLEWFLSHGGRKSHYFIYLFIKHFFSIYIIQFIIFIFNKLEWNTLYLIFCSKSRQFWKYKWYPIRTESISLTVPGWCGANAQRTFSFSRSGKRHGVERRNGLSRRCGRSWKKPIRCRLGRVCRTTAGGAIIITITIKW